MRRLTLVLLRWYRYGLAPLARFLGAECRFVPSCSEYAMEAFRTLPWPRAAWRSVCRVCSCQPWVQWGDRHTCRST
ncbi:MAG: membrane protein insertion efficiency factor YidD [Deltaproteobacteria bacterium]|nr:membrane protein insertion efficiency factor YidD [Deltaproteobacteria bacterium]